MQAEADSPIGLVGGEEFRGPAAAFDRRLLSLASRIPASVAILPTAAATENPDLAAANGLRHFRSLDAEPYAVSIHDAATANDERLVDELRPADIVYFTGGNPAHLLESLKDSAAWSCLLKLRQDGVILAGSSAGAMVLGERMLYGGRDLAGLALLPGVAVLPHFERASEERVERLRSGLPPNVAILGIAGATGCVRHEGEWLVEGPGEVTLIARSGSEVFAAGARFTLTSEGALPPR